MILSEILKARLNHGRPPNLYYWRDKQGHEIDCLIEHGTDLTAVELKSGQTINNSYLNGLAYWRKLTGYSHNYVVYGGKQPQKRLQGTVVPWQKALMTG